MMLYSVSLVNKKATKFVTARKTIANVNLRGIYILHSYTAEYTSNWEVIPSRVN